MRVLVTGGSGFVGSKFVKALSKSDEVHFTVHNNNCTFEGCTGHALDINEQTNVTNLIKEIKPELVIHTVALPGMDLCETNKELCREVNVEGTQNIVSACKQVNGKIVFISTSAVFDGLKDSYSEDDEPNPISYHGDTHLEGEKIVRNSGLPFLIFRIDHPYGWVEPWQRKNSVIRIFEKLEKGEITKEVVDWYNTPTFIDNLVDVSIELIRKDKGGIYHIVGPDFINRYELALKVADVLGKDKNLVQQMNSKELNLPARRSPVRMVSKKAEKDSGLKLVGVGEGLEKMLKN